MTPTPAATPDPVSGEAGIEQHRGYLYRFALLQLRDAERAQDAVQETLLAALENRAGYGGRSAMKTWLVGILKHKIIDQIRRQARDHPAESRALEAEDADLGEPDPMFVQNGHWAVPPQSWADPAKALENKRFWEVFELCAEVLPENSARVFMMRELMGLDTDAICKELHISATNCWVLLYRARMRLRECLEKNWFVRG
jgi:RNA polymerase sigma-70 factor (ECF subfamily)